MSFRELSERPENRSSDTMDSRTIERRIQEAQDLPEQNDPADTFRYSDASLGGEVRTSASQGDGPVELAQAEVVGRDGARQVVGTARYSMRPDEAFVHSNSVIAPNHGVEDALLSEIGDQARNRGADRLKIWAADGDTRWSSHGFQPMERNPGAKGVHWEKRL